MMRRALLALLLVACAGSPLQLVETPDDVAQRLLHQTPWLRAEVYGITLYSNATPERTRRVLTKLARFIDLFQQLGGPAFQPDRPVEIFVFARAAEWKHFTSENVLGHALERPSAYRLGMSAERSAYDVLLHELVHLALLVRPGRDFPAWYHEGLAEVLSSAVIREDLAVLGRVLDLRADVLEGNEALSLELLLSDRAARTKSLSERFYADAFAFVHYELLAEEPQAKPRLKEFDTFVTRVRDGAAWRQVFEASFSDDLDTIQTEFERYRMHLATRDVLRAVVIELNRPLPEFTLAQVGDAEIARALVGFGESTDFDPRLAGSLWQVVLAANPDDVGAQLGSIRAAAAQGGVRDAAARLAAIPRAQADAADYAATAAAVHLAEAEALRDQGDAVEAHARFDAARAEYERVLELRPEDVFTQTLLGITYADDSVSDAARGIEILERVDAAWPDQAPVRLALAVLRTRRGDYAAARDDLDFVRAEEIDDSLAERAKDLAKEIDRLSPEESVAR